MLDVLSAFGLSSSAGLNAYLPLFAVGLFGRFTDIYEFSDPWSTLTDTWVLIVLGVLVVVELVVDKIPLVDSINDVVSTAIRPIAGALLFASTTGAVSNLPPAVALILGLTTAGAVHATKTTARPAVTASTAGVGNMVVSLGEDVLALLLTMASVFLPIVAAIMTALLLVPMFMAVRWWSRQRSSSLA